MSELSVQDLVTVARAIEILDQAPVFPRVESVALADCTGLRLAEDIVADRDYPPFRKALMDGFAMRAADAKSGVELKVVGRIPAGNIADHCVREGEAMAIMTGAPLPDGADAVVPVEESETIADGTRVRILARIVKLNQNIAGQGSDCRSGRMVLGAGTSIGPAQIAVAATVGTSALKVFLPPRVAVLGTGSELVDAKTTARPWQIRNSNSPMLVALLRRLGCEVSDLGFVRDEPEEIRALLQKGLESDVLFVSGGMSMGEYDYVPRLLRELGVDLRITRLRIKPGKPFVYGVFSKGAAQAAANPPRYVFGLPGNPVSAYVCVLRLASRLLARMAGGSVEERWLTGRLDVGLPANGPREFYQPAVRIMPRGDKSAQSGFARISPLHWKGSADLFTLAQANAMIVRAENEPAMPIGTVVRVLEL